MFKTLVVFLAVCSVILAQIDLNRTENELEESEMDKCIRECPRTSEYNPVCGTDGRKYWNPGELACAQICGRDVQYHSQPPCSGKPVNE